MLFSYTYVPHQMEKMQQFIDFIFFSVWCKATPNTGYGLHLFAANYKLYSVMRSFHYSESKAANFFNRHVELIFNEFKKLSPQEIRQIRRWYKGNNNLERICAKDPQVHIARYEDIKRIFPALEEVLGPFFKGLYDNLDIAALKEKIGDISSHYKEFSKVNKVGKCPFCGIHDLLGVNHTKREPYDHYLPKKYYPFNSINFRNLVPACTHCNSSYKTINDPAHMPKDPLNAGTRRAVFYPFSKSAQNIELKIVLKHADKENLSPEDITLLFSPNSIAEKINTWRDVYGIDERYKAKLCTETDGKAWIQQVLDEWTVLGHDPDDLMRTLAFHTEKRPFSDCNFLKKPFLEAWRDMGLFTPVPVPN